MPAADRARRRLAVAARRVQDGAWSVGQCAVAAGIAWTAAQLAFDHSRPFFASAAAVVCLGLRPVQRLRRVFELAVGVTVGVAVGQALVSVVGQGGWQITLVIAAAMLVALAVDGGALVTAQAGLQAVFVVAFPAVPGQDLARWEDAMVGGGRRWQSPHCCRRIPGGRLSAPAGRCWRRSVRRCGSVPTPCAAPTPRRRRSPWLPSAVRRPA